MKKYLLIFLSVFSLFFLFDTVNAENDLYDYLFVTANVPSVDGSTVPLGSRNPGVTTTKSEWATINFGYYNINNTFKPGEKWRIVANYCVQGTDFNAISLDSSVNMNSIKYGFKYGDTCTYTSSSGYVSVGIDMIFTVDFTISDTDFLTGYSKFLITRPSTTDFFIAFKDYRIYPSSEITDNDNTQNIIDNQNKNQQETNDKLDEAENTRKGILGTLRNVADTVLNLPKKIVDLLLNALKSLFIPDNMDFINNFLNSIESKLGFIAEIPMSIINFTLNLANATWEDVTSISLPSIDIFGYKFWNAQEIDISEGLNIFKPFKYVTDCLCVVLLSKGLFKCWENFTGGGKE